MNIWLNFLVESIAFGATFMYGSTGEIITEKSGHLNLGIPGIMCMGGAGGCVMLNLIGKSSMPHFLIVLLGILASFAVSMAMGMIYGFLTVTLRCNQNVTGLCLTIFGVGLSWALMDHCEATRYLIKPKKYFRFPFAARTDSLQKLGVMFFLAIIIAIVASIFLYKTKAGLNLRAVGENPATADAVGINVIKYKYLAILIGSGIAGLGGFYYIIDFSGSGEAYKSVEAFGWLSVALVIFALWKPHMTIIGSIIFGFLFNLSAYITLIPFVKASLTTMPLLKMIPYVVTVLVLIFTSIRNKREN
ncbi:MAG: ABC transporter permease, partial [Firmicutes bacterium]|nr:ABC transporter permease [Candidatus Colimorpha enterica]